MNTPALKTSLLILLSLLLWSILGTIESQSFIMTAMLNMLRSGLIIFPFLRLTVWKQKRLTSSLQRSTMPGIEPIRKVFRAGNIVLRIFYAAAFFSVFLLDSIDADSPVILATCFTYSFMLSMLLYIPAFVSWFLISAFGAKLLVYSKTGVDPKFSDYLPTMLLLLNPLIGIWVIPSKYGDES